MRLHIIGDGESREEFYPKLERAGAEVLYHGKIYDAREKQAIFDQCYFGLNIMKETVSIGLTTEINRLFQCRIADHQQHQTRYRKTG